MKKQVKAHKQEKPISVAWRFYVVLGLILAVYCGLVARSAYIQVIEPDMLKQQAANRVIRNSTSLSQRGSIVDRNGRKLAVSVPVETVWADPKVVMDNNALAMVEHWRAMADVLSQDVNTLTNRIIRNPAKRFVYVGTPSISAMADYIKALKIPGHSFAQRIKAFLSCRRN